MIKVLTEEYREGDLAIRTMKVTLFHIPIFRYRKTSTNNLAVRQLTVVKKSSNIKGFV